MLPGAHCLLCYRFSHYTTHNVQDAPYFIHATVHIHVFLNIDTEEIVSVLVPTKFCLRS
jgi:hypothetical protein